MRFSVGGKLVGEVSDAKLEAYVPKAIDRNVVNGVIVDAIAKGIQRYQHLPGAREAWMRALGVSAPRKRKA